MKTLLRIGILALVLGAVGSCDGDGGDGGGASIDCQPPKPHLKDGMCVACLKDSDCPAAQSCSDDFACVCPASTPVWNDGECIGCTHASDCAQGELCDDCSATCVALSETCDKDYVCNAVCTECLADEYCAGAEICDLGAGVCVEDDCEGETPVLFDGDCVQCLVNKDCPGDLVCNGKANLCECEVAWLKVTDDGQCVECVNSFDCPQGEMCNIGLNQCEATTTGCPDDQPFFWSGECVECLDDSNCPVEGSSCHFTKHYCLDPPLDCKDHTPIEYQGECVQCAEYADCPEGKICDFNEHKCIVGGGGECAAPPGGTGTNIGDLVGTFALNDCLGNKHVLHDSCGSAKAIWFIMIAGWCGACKEYGPMAWEYAQGFFGQGLEIYFILGEDVGAAPPSQAFCSQYAGDQGYDPMNVLIDPHWQTFSSFIQIGGNSLPWDVLLDGDDMMFVWESVDPTFSLLQSELNKLLAD